jgi:uroporphyrinogen decarboxylase
VRKVKAEHPRVPITVYANGSGGLIERLGKTGADVVGLDWTVDMADARQRLGPDQAVQVRAPCSPSCMHLRRCALIAAWLFGVCMHSCDVGRGHMQGNVDPVVLFASEDAIEAAVKDCLSKAGPSGHILNLGHGVLVGTPEESVAHMFQLSKDLKY